MGLLNRVLIADDNHAVRIVVEKSLRRNGVDVTAVENGELAYQRAMAAHQAGLPYELIILDIEMPVMDGFEATALLRLHGYEGRIVALTALDDVADQCVLAGFDECYRKPIALDTLLNLVQLSAASKRLIA